MFDLGGSHVCGASSASTIAVGSGVGAVTRGTRPAKVRIRAFELGEASDDLLLSEFSGIGIAGNGSGGGAARQRAKLSALWLGGTAALKNKPQKEEAPEVLEKKPQKEAVAEALKKKPQEEEDSGVLEKKSPHVVGSHSIRNSPPGHSHTLWMPLF